MKFDIYNHGINIETDNLNIGIDRKSRCVRLIIDMVEEEGRFQGGTLITFIVNKKLIVEGKQT